ncbi:MAG: hypothetical protein ACNA7E_06100 [Wenzhouxiangellaceae bacterium]
MKFLFPAIILLLILAGCATPKADPSVLLGADDTIELAMRAGARDHAPLELDEALDLRRRAAAALEERGGESPAFLAERAALQARLAIVRAEGARTRSELERKQTELRRLHRDLTREFGDAIGPLESVGGDQ